MKSIVEWTLIHYMIVQVRVQLGILISKVTFGSKITINYPLNDLKDTMENTRAEYSHVLKAEKTRDMNILDERTSNIVNKKDELNCAYPLSL